MTVTAGEADNNNDFVEEQLANIRGNVKEDNNNDNTGDVAIANVTIQLKDAVSGAIVATTTTNAQGNYEFLNVAPGNYNIVEIQPAGYTSVSDVDATPDPDGNDGAAPNDIIPVVLVAGENDNDNNFVEEYIGTIGNFVWDDLNANGAQDAGEPGIANVLVRLFNSAGTQIGTMVTDANGLYQFPNLAPGNYTLKFEKPNGYVPTGKDKLGDDAKDSDADIITGLTGTIVLGAGESNQTIDAGFYKLASLGDYVWEDQNINGIQDALEPGIPNATVNLTGTDADGRAVNQSTTTNGTGFYQFTNLVPGTYTVTFVKPSATYKPSPANTPADDTKDSDANITTGAAPAEVLTSGENNPTIDAGFYRCATVGDYVWIDLNNNNIQDATDIGINDVTVQLFSSANPNTPVQSTVTINDPRNPANKGYYNFEVCTPGSYFIKVLKGDEYDFVNANQGTNDAIDSDVNDFIAKTTSPFVIQYAAEITDVDAGVKLRPLPVSLEKFTGRWNTGRDINELTWSTLSEVNNDYFEIERSFEGNTYEIIGKVDGNNNSSSKIDYAYDDVHIEKNGLYTYRLRQVDLDGKTTYSKEVVIRVDRKVSIRTDIYPNPSASRVTIEIGASEGSKVQADVYDNTGKLVIKGLLNTVLSNNGITATIESDVLNQGIYFVMVNIDGATTSHKLIIIE